MLMFPETVSNGFSRKYVTGIIAAGLRKLAANAVPVLLPLLAAPYDSNACAAIANVKTTLLEIIFGVQAIIYVVIALCYFIGVIEWSAPTHSMMFKRAGQENMQIAAVAVILLLVGPAIIGFLILVIGQITGGVGFPGLTNSTNPCS